MADGVDESLEVQDFERQEIRVAAVLNGGVSLAVWMSGVTVELNHLALASQGRGAWPTYRGLLDLLQATARVDVIAGTSAGGLNGAFLALALARHKDVMLLRDVWRDDGALEALLRPALSQDPPSLLQGDDYFLPRILEALARTEAGPEVPGGDAAPTPVELILTGTLWSGRVSVFTDDMNVGIVERDYDALFSFDNAARESARPDAGDLNSDGAIPALANAARCTSSFPGAFEPHWVEHTADAPTPQTWATTAGRANFDTSQFVLDGGILLNTPLRPALDAIYRQPADRQVRRVLAFVVPDPAEAPAAEPDSSPAPVPGAADVLLGVMTRLRSTDSVSRQLAEIRDRNAEVRTRRHGRARLAAALAGDAGGLAQRLWPGYRAERIGGAARTIGRLMAQGQPAGAGVWSERELVTALSRPDIVEHYSFVPPEQLSVALRETGDSWSWGQTTVLRLVDMAGDILRRAVWLAPVGSDLQRRVVGCRNDLTPIVTAVQRDRQTLNEFWLTAAATTDPAARLPRRDSGPDATARNTQQLLRWLVQVLPGWDDARVQRDVPSAAVPDAAPPTIKSILYGQALSIATVLHRHRGTLLETARAGNPLVDPDGEEQEQIGALCGYLVGGARSARAVLDRMLRLDVVQLAVAGSSDQAEQEVELVQVSCTTPDRLTGLQLHHFGAFYRAPWRVNDWVVGRLDGVKQVIRFVLAPQRLQQCGWSVPSGTPQHAAAVETAVASLLDRLRAVAAPADHPHQAWLDQQWQGSAPQCENEIRRVVSGDPSPTALDTVTSALAVPAQLDVLMTDLPALADAIRKEREDTPAGSLDWLAAYDAFVGSIRPAAGAADGDPAVAAGWWRLGEAMSSVGKQRILPDEIGTDTFAVTVSQAAAVAVSAFAPPRRARKVAPIGALLSAVRGYTLMLWAIVHYQVQGSNFGARVVGMVLAAGAALIAVTLLVPGVPLALTLAGVLIVLAGVTASALRTPGGRGVTIRVGLAAVLVAAALGVLIWRDVHDHGTAHPGVAAGKIGIGIAIVLLGVWVARARPRRRRRRRGG